MESNILNTKLRFIESKKNGELIAFVHKDKTGRLLGINEDSQFRKLICVVSAELKKLGTVKPGILYDVEMVPMGIKQGYVVKSAEVSKFSAHIKTEIVPKAIYRITVKFGHKTLIFDPFDPQNSKQENAKNIEDVLASREDVYNPTYAIERFRKAANFLLKRMEDDKVNPRKYVGKFNG